MILFYGLLLSLFLEYVNPEAFVPAMSATKIGTIVPLLTFFLVIFQSKPVSNMELIRHPTSIWIGIFLMLTLLSVFIADVTLYSWTLFKGLLGFIFWYVMLVKLVTDVDRLKKVVGVLIASHVLILVLNPQVILAPETRSYVTAAPFLGDGNDFSLSLCVLLPLCAWLFMQAQSSAKKTMLVVALIVTILAIIGTQSRGATLALIGVSAFLWWRGKKKFKGVVLISITLLVVALFAPPQYFERMRSITEYQQEGSAMGRIMAWKAGTRMAIRYPVTGVGTGHFSVALGTEFRPPEFNGQNLPWLTAHSMYFLVLGELGIPGIICYLAILIGSYRRLNKLLKDARGSPVQERREFGNLFLMLNASLVAYCVGGAFLSVTYYPHIFVLAGLIVASTMIYDRQDDPR